MFIGSSKYSICIITKCCTVIDIHAVNAYVQKSRWSTLKQLGIFFFKFDFIF